MHGIILKTLKDYVVDRHDRETWETVQREAGREGEMYVAVTSYDEEVTVDLVEATLDVTDTTMGDFMYDWGVWIIAPIVDIYGSAYVDADWDGLDLLSEIENIHHRLRQRRMGSMTPPVLQIEYTDDEQLSLVYSSQREWCQWIPGLVKGVGDYYGEEFHHEEHTCMLDGDEQCSFTIERTTARTTRGAEHASTD